MKHLLLLFALIATLSCCKNDDDQPQNPIDQLPPATQTGENTFGYMVNGKPIVVTNTTKITAIYQQNQLQLGGGIENSQTDVDLRIILQNPIMVKNVYDLTNYPTHRSRYIDFHKFSECTYDYQNTYEGFIKFTKIDQTNYIISGTFEFSTVTDNCEDIKITNGRFDVKYIP